jgi:hypothetical protein
MKTFTISFVGRPIGGIDGTAAVRVTRKVQAESKQAAQLKAYETHEHIAGGADWVLCTEETEQ